MPQEGKRWRHVIISTLNSWLPGDPRGFRAVDHKIHSSGDYKNPPPAGEHAGLHRYSQKISGEVVIIPRDLREIIGIALRDELGRLDHNLLAISVAATHCHMQVELPDDRKEIRRIIGEAKRKASVAVRKQMPGSVWAHDGKYEPIDTPGHQVNVYNYIWNKQDDAWIWSFKEGVKTTWVEEDEEKEGDPQAPP
jgi:REP element-mobilizing transposase RayT